MDGGFDDDWSWGDYEIPFSGMSQDEFLYRAMNVNDPMYMGDRFIEEVEEVEEDEDEEDERDEEDDDDEIPETYEERVAKWKRDQVGKIIDALYQSLENGDDDPQSYFDNIEYDPFPEE